jgi:hypothetical protein
MLNLPSLKTKLAKYYFEVLRGGGHAEGMTKTMKNIYASENRKTLYLWFLDST